MSSNHEPLLRSGLGILLEREIKRSGLSLNEFSRRAGVLPATVSKLVNGQQRTASRPTLQKLAAFTGHELWGLEMLGEPIDVSDLPEVTPPPGVLALESPVDRAIDEEEGIPPSRKRWLKQCVEFARKCP